MSGSIISPPNLTFFQKTFSPVDHPDQSGGRLIAFIAKCNKIKFSDKKHLQKIKIYDIIKSCKKNLIQGNIK